MAKKTAEQVDAEFVALVTKKLPTLSLEEKRFYLENPKTLEQFLKEGLSLKPKIAAAHAYFGNQEVEDINRFVAASKKLAKQA